MVSMKDIAKKCGVSVATVSKALNDAPDISTETKERIRKIADETARLSKSFSSTAITTLNRTSTVSARSVSRAV